MMKKMLPAAILLTAFTSPSAFAFGVDAESKASAVVKTDTAARVGELVSLETGTHIEADHTTHVTATEDSASVSSSTHVQAGAEAHAQVNPEGAGDPQELAAETRERVETLVVETEERVEGMIVETGERVQELENASDRLAGQAEAYIVEQREYAESYVRDEFIPWLQYEFIPWAEATEQALKDYAEGEEQKVKDYVKHELLPWLTDELLPWVEEQEERYEGEVREQVETHKQKLKQLAEQLTAYLQDRVEREKEDVESDTSSLLNLVDAIVRAAEEQVTHVVARELQQGSEDVHTLKDMLQP